MSDETLVNDPVNPEPARPASAAMAPPIVASPAKRIQRLPAIPTS